MDPSELRLMLSFPTFRPCVVTTNNGERYRINHPEMAQVTFDTLYVFEVAADDPENLIVLAAMVAVVNICSLRRIDHSLQLPLPVGADDE